eukprot:1671288-Amphidinium_carterae.1
MVHQGDEQLYKANFRHTASIESLDGSAQMGHGCASLCCTAKILTIVKKCASKEQGQGANANANSY